MADFPYREISMNSIKGKIFYEFDESFELDQNGRRSYGDTYTPTFNHNYYFFDSNGRISRWLKEMIQNNQVISSIDSLYSYNRDDIHVNVTKYLVGYQPIVSEYSIASNKQNETIKFESKIISGINLDGPGFSFYSRSGGIGGEETELVKLLSTKRNYCTLAYLPITIFSSTYSLKNAKLF